MRIGILGTSSITPLSLVQPAAATGHRLVAVAARHPRRGRAFADEHGVESVHESFQAVLDDPEVDVVYNPLPNSFHAPWNIKAARAGKHVLAEKPSALDAAQAEEVRAAVDAAGVVFLEAFHYPYHPLFQRGVCAARRRGGR
jgi:predicted dehydrogenase